MRPAIAELDAAVGLDAVAGGDQGVDLAAMRIALAPGDKKGSGGADCKPPAMIGIALVKDVGSAGFERRAAAGNDIVNLGRGQLEPYRPALPRIVEQMQLEPAGAGAGLGPGQALIPLFKPGAGFSGIGVASSSRISAWLSWRSAPAAIGINATAMSRNTAAGRAALASAKVARRGARRLR
jgi:hypothetical protein